MKNYITFINDHSGSMSHLRAAALRDYNTNVNAVKDAASREMMDTIVSVVALGIEGHGSVVRTIVNSNPHVLKPMDDWPTPGNTPLYDAIGNAIELNRSMPDYNSKDVSFLIVVTTDGEEYGSKKYTKGQIASLISQLNQEERWTFVFRVPKNGSTYLRGLNIPEGNIQEWDTTAAGMAASTAKTTQAFDGYYASRSAGKKSSTVFYADASAVSVKAVTSKLVDVSKDVSLYVVPASDNGIEIKPFILRHRMEYLKGSAFYQLTKTESKVSHTKLIALRDRTTGAIYSGDEARSLIGLPTGGNARLHPGDHGNYDIFIQSDSINRKLVGGTGVLYWAKIGKPFTEADLAYLNRPAVAPAKPAVVELPKVVPTGKPTPSPIPVTKKGPLVNGKPVQFFDKRSEAREFGKTLTPFAFVKDVCDFATGIGSSKKRWFIFI